MNNTISKEDVVQVCTNLKQTLTEEEIQEAIERYPSEQDDDTSATSNLVVEKIMYDLINER